MHASKPIPRVGATVVRFLPRFFALVILAVSGVASLTGCELDLEFDRHVQLLPPENGLRGRVHVRAILRDQERVIGEELITDISGINVSLDRESGRVPTYGTYTFEGTFTMSDVEKDRYQARFSPTPQHDFLTEWVEMSQRTDQQVEFETDIVTEPQGSVQTFPNPSSDHVKIRFELSGAGQTDVFLVRSRIVATHRTHTLYQGHLPAGTHEMEWDGLASGSLGSLDGLYMLVVNQGDEYQFDWILRYVR